MPAGGLETDREARSGKLVRVTLKPGLPQGTLQQKIVLKTNLDEVPEVPVKVYATLGGDISVVAVGSGWDAERNLLRLGTVDATKGVSRKLLLVVRGKHREQVQFEPVKVFPKWLEISMGKTVQIGNGMVNQTPLSITIPPNASSAVHLGSEQGKLGEVRLKTNHPDVPELKIDLQFATEGG
jgi:hypothetical protein